MTATYLSENVSQHLGKVISYESYSRSSCPQMRADMAQSAWLACLEYPADSLDDCEDEREVVQLLRNYCVVPTVSHYYWRNQSVVSCSRPKKGSLIPSNVSHDDALGDSHNEDKFIFSSEIQRLNLERKIFCENILSIKVSDLLPEREEQIIRNRFLTEKPSKRREIAKNLCVSEERTRQLENQAVKRLRLVIKRDFGHLSNA